jgi:hypothetical protein
MSTSNRIFSERIIPSLNVDGRTEWYCLAREGMLGPYPSEEVAILALKEFIEWCQQVGATGGRDDAGPKGNGISHPDLMRWLAEGVIARDKL